MPSRYLQVTFRDGKPFAAYLYLPRKKRGKAARTADMGDGLLVDYDATGAPMGVEIVSPSAVTLKTVNTVLARLGQPVLSAREWAPLRAA
jgi:uncharacterized protein YuzE